MADYIVSPKAQQYGHAWAMQSGEMMEALGLKAGGHLPLEGMPERTIQGIKVWVTPALLPATGRKSSTHRVMCECPVCHKTMSAGRLHQHWRKVHKGK